MVKIRLRRLGAKKAPSTALWWLTPGFPRDGRFIEEIGTYNPCVSPRRSRSTTERAQAWIKSAPSPPTPSELC